VEEENVISLTAPVATRTLGILITDIRAVVRSGTDDQQVAERVAEILQPHLSMPDFLSEAQLEADPTQYRQHILHIEDDGSFSIVALVWLPGQATPIHDHVAWCVVGVHQGEEHETVYERIDTGNPYLIETSHTINPVGSVAALTPPGDIHHVLNAGEGKAVSIHVYGADIGTLGSSIRRRYDLDVRPAS